MQKSCTPRKRLLFPRLLRCGAMRPGAFPGVPRGKGGWQPPGKSTPPRVPTHGGTSVGVLRGESSGGAARGGTEHRGEGAPSAPGAKLRCRRGRPVPPPGAHPRLHRAGVTRGGCGRGNLLVILGISHKVPRPSRPPGLPGCRPRAHTPPPPSLGPRWAVQWR